MTDFKPLPIKDGVGPVHLNRYRISMHPSRDPAAAARIGRELFGMMVQYMDPRSASVQVDSRSWNGEKTLRFRGVAMFRPFEVGPSLKVPTAIPRFPTALPTFKEVQLFSLPAWVRDLVIPDVHTDSVGAVARTPTSFTAQTLKREFETSDDATIRDLIKIPNALPDDLADVLGDIAVSLNQHHFLAGRRSFHFDHGAAFGYTDARLVFETAAIERYSLPIYELATDNAMGSAAEVVKPVWIQTARRVASANGLPIVVEMPQAHWTKEQEVHFIQEELSDIGQITSSSHWPEMSRLHPKVFEPE